MGEGLKRARRAALATRKPKIAPYKMKRFGILNHVGGIWTPETFGTPEEAQAHIDRQHGKFLDLSKHTVIPVLVTVRAVQ